jgi:hypothetical protein
VIRRMVVVAVALLTAGSLPVSAQFPGLPRVGAGVDSPYWVGLSYGYVSGTTISDGASSTTWEFGYTSELRASFEKTIQPGVTIGASAGFATAPLTYISTAFSSACAGQCAANADITQYMAFVRAGGGLGFHVVYSLEAGATEFSKFRTRDGSASLAPDNAKYDFSFGLGAGFGYGFSRTAEAYAGEQWDLVFHPQGSATNTDAPRMFTFRAGLRIGF